MPSISSLFELKGEKLNKDFDFCLAAVASKEKSSLITTSKEEARSAPRYKELSFVGEKTPISDRESNTPVI